MQNSYIIMTFFYLMHQQIQISWRQLAEDNWKYVDWIIPKVNEMDSILLGVCKSYERFIKCNLYKTIFLTTFIHSFLVSSLGFLRALGTFAPTYFLVFLWMSTYLTSTIEFRVANVFYSKMVWFRFLEKL